MLHLRVNGLPASLIFILIKDVSYKSFNYNKDVLFPLGAHQPHTSVFYNIFRFLMRFLYFNKDETLNKLELE